MALPWQLPRLGLFFGARLVFAVRPEALDLLGVIARVVGLLRHNDQDRVAGARDVIYWVKEDYGFKPVLSIVHGVVYQPPARADRAYVVQKQIYANHYFDGSLALATALSATEQGAPVTYLVYVNRSRGDMLRGGLGGLKRNAAQSQARKAAQETLGTIKSQLEK